MDNLQLEEELQQTPIYKQAYKDAMNNGTKEEPKSDGKQQSPSDDPWPTLAKEALHGLAGDIVSTIEPYTEADPVAVLITLLVMFGNVINASTHFLVECPFTSQT